MPDNPTPGTDPEPTTSPVSGPVSAPIRRRIRKCRTCGHRCTTALIHGQCATCAGLLALPLRGEGGRFLSVTADPTGADVFSGGGR